MRNRLLWLLIAAGVIGASFQSPVRGAERIKSAKPTVVQAQAVSKPTEVREFEVRVDNTPRGTHRLTIKSDNENLNVDVETDVKVDLIVYAYVFKFRGNEIWRDGRLLHSDIKCEDGSKKRSFSLKTDDGIQQVSYNGKPVKSSSGSVLTTAYWHLPHSELLDKSMTIADVDNGRILTAKFHEVGPDTVSVGNKTISCRHFKIDGPSPAELWFDDQDHLVRQKSVEQGHPMELRLKQIRIVKDER